jgi:histidinol-phosphate/aromatic aminotransferase/cobyric acid decarboxylase-like protein
MTYSAEAHVVSALASIPRTRKTDYRGWINRASNECAHPRIDALVERWSRTIDPSSVSQYPYHPLAQAALADHFGLTPTQVELTAGADSAIAVLLRTLATRHRRLILGWPAYYTYEYYARGLGLEQVHADVSRAESAIDALIDAAGRSAEALVVLTNPDGYTGACASIAEIRRLARVCLERNQILVIDETYGPFAPICHARLIDEYPNVIVVHSFSKGCGSAGLRLGAILGPATLLGYVARALPMNAVSGLSLDFLRFALAHPGELETMRSDVRDQRRRLEERLRHVRPNWHVPSSHANFVFADTKEPDTAVAVEACLARRGIVIRRLATFPPYRSALRITVRGTHDDQDLLDAIGSER